MLCENYVIYFSFSLSSSGAVHISYAHLHRHNEDEMETFYTRQLTHPVTVTVYQTLECSDMSIMPMGALSNLPSAQVNLRDITSDSLHQWCLFSIEVRNTYGSPFEVTFTRSQDGMHQLVFHIGVY